MRKVRSSRTPPLVLAAAMLVALAVAGGTALAGHLSGGVKSYTGCLAVGGGTMSLIKEGDVSLKTCPSGSVQVHFSGGDITEIAAGTGVQVVNGENGEATIALDAKYSLPQSCSSDDFAKWNGSGWACGRYSKGTGLALNGTEFSIAPEYQVKNGQTCDSGQFAKGITSAGALDCAALPPPPSKQAYFKRLPTAPVFKLSLQTAISLSLPAGKYIVTATATAHDDDDNETTVECSLYQGATFLGGSDFWGDDVVDAGSPDTSARGSIAITAATTLGAAGTVELKCSSTRGNDSLSDPAITAVEVDGITVQ
jgi:hypothetical protein